MSSNASQGRVIRGMAKVAVGNCCQAVQAFVAEHEEEVTVAEGQLLQLLSENLRGRRSKGWKVVWTGLRSGYIPSACLKKVSSSALQKHPDGPLTAATALSGEECAATNRQRKLEWPLCFVEALCDYEARKPGELSFKGGDLIGVVQKRPSGWWKGTLDGTLVGRFPLNHTCRLSTRHSLPKRLPPSSSTIPLLPQLPIPLPSFPSPNSARSPRPSALSVSSPFFASTASSSSSASSSGSSNSPSAVLPTSARSLHASEPRLRGQGSSALRAGVSWGADESVQLIHEQLASALSQLSAGALRPAECQTSFRELPLARKEELLTALEASDGSVEHWRLLLGTLLSSLLSPAAAAQ